MIFNEKKLGTTCAFSLEDSTGDFAMSSSVTSFLENIHITKHAEVRMNKRGITRQMLELVLMFGRKIYARGVVFYVIGKKEIQRFHKKEAGLKNMEGIQVLTSVDGVVITTYRNRDLRAIRPESHKHRHSH